MKWALTNVIRLNYYERFPSKSFLSRENCNSHSSKKFGGSEQRTAIDETSRPIRHAFHPTKFEQWYKLQINNGYCLCLRQDSKFVEILRLFHLIFRVDGKWKPLNCVLRMRNVFSFGESKKAHLSARLSHVRINVM